MYSNHPISIGLSRNSRWWTKRVIILPSLWNFGSFFFFFFGETITAKSSAPTAFVWFPTDLLSGLPSGFWVTTLHMVVTHSWLVICYSGDQSLVKVVHSLPLQFLDVLRWIQSTVSLFINHCSEVKWSDSVHPRNYCYTAVPVPAVQLQIYIEFHIKRKAIQFGLIR